MILNGWKEIANHLGRGVRTVQRWEQAGLPVRRPNSRLRSAVICTTEELDAWIKKCASGRTLNGEILVAEQPLVPSVVSIDFRERLHALAIQVAAVKSKATRVYEQTEQIRARMEARGMACQTARRRA